MKLLIFLFVCSVGFGQSCGVQQSSIKPITPIGCTDTAQACVCSGSVCTWQWVCLTDQHSVSNGNTSDPLSVFQGGAAQPTKPFDVGAYQDERARAQAETNALNAAAAESRARTAAIMATPEMQAYYQRIASERQQNIDARVQYIQGLENRGELKAAMSATKASLSVYPGSPVFKGMLTQLKSDLKAQKRSGSKNFESHPVDSRP